MHFIQEKDGSTNICFSDSEIKIINEKGKLFLKAESMRHFSNALINIVLSLQNFDEKISKLQTTGKEVINGE
jgi:hypothetical protein